MTTPWQQVTLTALCLLAGVALTLSAQAGARRRRGRPAETKDHKPRVSRSLLTPARELGGKLLSRVRWRRSRRRPAPATLSPVRWSHPAAPASAPAPDYRDPATRALDHQPAIPVPSNRAPASALPAQGARLSIGPAAPGAPAPLSRRAWLYEQGNGQEHLLLDDRTSLGRSADAGITIDDPTVSRTHAMLLFERGGWWLLPEVTSNGTFCNGRLVQPGERLALSSHDVLQLGDVRLLLVASAPAAGTQSIRFSAAARTTPGRRLANHDAHLVSGDVLAVADGVGDQPGGGLASRAAIDSVDDQARTAELRSVIDAAHRAVSAAGTAHRQPSAATLDVVRLTRHGRKWMLQGAHVGDGWVLMQDGEDVHRLTVPDRLGDRVAAVDPQRAAELADDPDYDRLASALGFPRAPEPVLWSREALVGRRIFLTSDGLTDVLGIDDLVALLASNRDRTPDEVAELVLAVAVNAADNVTFIVADLDVVDSRDAEPAAKPPMRALQRAIDPLPTSTTGGDS